MAFEWSALRQISSRAGRRLVSKTDRVGFDTLAGCQTIHESAKSRRPVSETGECRCKTYLVIQLHTGRGLPASPLRFERKARRFDSCPVFHVIGGLHPRHPPARDAQIKHAVLTIALYAISRRQTRVLRSIMLSL